MQSHVRSILIIEIASDVVSESSDASSTWMPEVSDSFPSNALLFVPSHYHTKCKSVCVDDTRELMEWVLKTRQREMVIEKRRCLRGGVALARDESENYYFIAKYCFIRIANGAVAMLRQINKFAIFCNMLKREIPRNKILKSMTQYPNTSRRIWIILRHANIAHKAISFKQV